MIRDMIDRNDLLGMLKSLDSSVHTAYGYGWSACAMRVAVMVESLPAVKVDLPHSMGREDEPISPYGNGVDD